MSRPGYWRMADGSDAPIADMRVAHLRNSMRLLGRRIRENASLPTDAGELQRVKTNRRTFYTDKLIELADEAERRGGILPAGDLTEAQLIELVTGSPLKFVATPHTAQQELRPEDYNLLLSI